MSVKGACNCGQVAFEVDAPVRDIFVCHCSICRRYTGSSGIAVVIVENGAFRWLEGTETIRMWQKPGADWQAWFCQICGSPVPGPNNATHMFIPAGLIGTGGEDLKVAAHIFVGSKAPWDEIGDEGRQYPVAFGA
jgi:hypothetical protein